MGALATPQKWIPEDDLLLKNAVEAGASLESLAKGAVRFSRHFTLRELLERWRSLLYDPEVSAEASARMIEFELELSSSNPPKPTRTCLKGKDCLPEKRKGDSIRSHYHAWRKRIRNRHYASVHPDLPEELCSEIMANCGYDCGDSLNHDYQQLQGGNIPLQEQKINYFGHPQTGCGNSENDFSGVLKFNSNASNGNMVQNNPVHAYTGNLCLEPGEKTDFNNVPLSLENEYTKKNHSQEDNLIAFDTCSEDHKIKLAQKLPISSQCAGEDVEVKSITVAGSSNDVIAENSNTRMLVPVWRTSPGISGETMGLDVDLDSKEEDNRCDDRNELNAPRFDNTSSEANMNGGISDGGINSTMVVESALMDYMGFGDDNDFLFLNVDDKDLGSILLNSPSDSHQEDSQKEMKTSPIALEIPDAACFEESSRNEQHDDNGLKLDHSRSTGKEATGTSSKASQTTEPLTRLPPCILNTEDPEIPNNDHISVLAQFMPTCLAPINSPFANEKYLTGDSITVKEEHVPVIQTSIASFEEDSTAPLNVGPVHSVENCLTEVETPTKGLESEPSIDVHISSKSSCLPQDTCAPPDDVPVEDQVNNGFQNGVNFSAAIVSPLENPTPGSGHSNMYSQDVINGCKSELSMQALHDCAPLADLAIPQPAVALSTSDLDERVSDSEDDVPNFSDIEAMILDMDLGPYDQESCLFNKEVSQYQPIHSKKTIIRLEQGARAYMNRKVSYNGAFAVFYGRYLKYFIRTPQISLGRATDDVKVDIDLGREGRANKISRRQAIIRMDNDGSFFLKNLGKYSIFLNGREVASQKCANLTSGCLIEIRNLRFVFEVNESAVRSYVATLRKSNQEKSALVA